MVHAHMLAAGLVFTFAVCQLDPVRRRWSTAVRGATLLAAGAAHAVLAKTLYALPPPGTDFTPADLHSRAGQHEVAEVENATAGDRAGAFRGLVRFLAVHETAEDGLPRSPPLPAER
ncbi:cytochrome c oxidase assembly protein [Streptomyces sp. URMC 128]|uniref:cytochrome c oxidase assembly protein n=1 Tax=Streptomyces sp. URMC 128 TaxID=3423404 RepID=UPI003F19B04C